MQVEVCDCTPAAVALVRHHLWPATPIKPVLAFYFDLLEQLEALLLECQAAAKDFCAALLARLPWLYRQQACDYNIGSM